jgi:hypothetical protein
MDTRTVYRILLLLLFATCSAFPALAGTAEKADVNSGEARVYFDVSLGEPEKLVVRLGLIEKTRDDLIAAGLTPRIVVGIRGKASNFFTRDEDYVLESDLAVKKNILAQVARFKTMGIRLEQCGLAADMQGIATTDFLPQLEMVGNGYVAMITYQGQGYAYVPMD